MKKKIKKGDDAPKLNASDEKAINKAYAAERKLMEAKAKKKKR